MTRHFVIGFVLFENNKVHKLIILFININCDLIARPIKYKDIIFEASVVQKTS